MTKIARKPVETRKLCARGKEYVQRKLKSEGMRGDKGAEERLRREWLQTKDMQ